MEIEKVIEKLLNRDSFLNLLENDIIENRRIFDNAIDTALLYSELTSFPFSSTTIPFTISAQGLGIFMPANISGQIEITSLSFKKLITAKFLLFFPLYLQFVPIIQALTNTFIFITPNQIYLHNHSTTPL